METAQICNLICDYLDILKEEEVSKYVNFATLMLSFIINIGTNDDICEAVRKIINFYGK